MKAYELLFFVAPNTDEETRAGVMKRIDVAITAEGGVVDSVEDWGKRKLAFEIDDPHQLPRRPPADRRARPSSAHQRRCQAPHGRVPFRQGLSMEARGLPPRER